MDDSETYMNVEFAKKDARSPSRDGLTCTYSELNFRKDKPLIVKDEDPPIASGPGELPITAQTDVLTSTYSELNFRKDKALIDEDEDPPIASGSGELPITAQTDGLTSTYTVLNLPKDELHIDEDEDPPIASGSAETYVTAQEDGLNSSYSLLKLGKTELPIDEDEDPPIAVRPADLSVAAQAGPRKQEPNENIGNRPDSKIWLHCLVTSALFLTVVGLSIHVSQIPQSQITCDRNNQLLREENHEMNRTQRQCRLQIHELNATIESTISEISHLNLSQRTCLNNLSALNTNLSDLKQSHTELRKLLIKVKKKYKSANEAKARICELLTSRRELTCPQKWIENEDRCYLISSLKKPYDAARVYCSNFDARLLEINSKEEENFVEKAVREKHSSYWIGKCKDGKVSSNIVYKMSDGKSECSECKSGLLRSCKNDQLRFICEKSASLCPGISEKLKDLCQQSVGPSRIK
ncbi:uncharacterized protein [Hemitrygon akajei]|uniref:uncharacterized protein n=1 Tax=Hemitrygon akajei TaxID=2704970 RepID=UPI003BF9E3A1